MKQLIIIRGLPGSGKSTLAQKIGKEYNIPIFEADMWFYNNEIYEWKSSELINAHKFCYLGVKTTLISEQDCIVANTNLSKEHLYNYVRLGRSFDYNVIIIHCLNKFINIHSVPISTIEKMKQNVYCDPTEYYSLNGKIYLFENRIPECEIPLNFILIKRDNNDNTNRII